MNVVRIALLVEGLCPPWRQWPLLFVVFLFLLALLLVPLGRRLLASLRRLARRGLIAASWGRSLCLRDHRRRCDSATARRCLEDFCSLSMLLLARLLEGRLAKPVRGMQLCALGEQQLEDIRLALGRSNHQRREPKLILPLQIGTRIKQNLSGIHVTVGARIVQGRLAVLGIWSLQIGPRGNERAEGSYIAIQGRLAQILLLFLTRHARSGESATRLEAETPTAHGL
mmetsp:Transcript_39953/g.105584  ORF Transcript_39953/g.105584 Transcript_39953/m.105584 type:complete len:227 (-) Transcript_39953:55-735(-)